MDYKLPKRTKKSHKGTYGRVLNIAGSKYMPGAGYLSSVSALKIGCGYCFLLSEEAVLNSVSSQTQNIVFVPHKNLKSQLKNSNVVSIGCGLTTSLKAKKIFIETIKHITSQTLIIDADGLNILSKINIKLPNKIILTPHPKEASRLLNIDIEILLKNPEFYAKTISQKYNCITVLKSHNTIITDGNTLFINKSGNSALAKAGSGDVLTGMIAGLVAQGLEPIEACKTAVYLHGLCGELASEKLTEYCVMASDLIEHIPNAIKFMTDQNNLL